MMEQNRSKIFVQIGKEKTPELCKPHNSGVEIFYFYWWVIIMVLASFL